MKNISIVLIALILIVGSSCSNTKAKDTNNDSMSVETNEPIQEKHLPDGAVPFDYARHLYFNILLRDSIPAKVIFDTGNTNILIDSTFYETHFAHLGKLQKAMARGAGSGNQATYIDMSGWEYSVGEHHAMERMAVVMNLKKILGSKVEGMFGMAFMRGRKVEFNYEGQYMRVLPQEEQLAEGYACIKCSWLDDRQTRMLIPVDVTIDENTSLKGNFLVDMGAGDAISINSSTAKKANLPRVLTEVKKKVYDVGGVGGSRTDYMFKAKGITIGGIKLDNVDASYSGNTQGAMADSRYDGIIGNALLEHFDVVFDFAACEIWLRTNGNNTFARYDSGITLTPKEDYWVVNGLIEGGKAHKVGIERGDRITSINGLTPENLEEKTLKKINATADGWEVIIKRGNATSVITFEKEEL